MLAIASALEGMSRAIAARAARSSGRRCGMPCCASTTKGRAGLIARPFGGRPDRVSEGEQAALVAYVLRGPDPERNEPSSWMLPDVCRFIEARLGKTMLPQFMSRVVRRLGLSRQKARPMHPQPDARAAEAFAQRGSPLP